MPQGLEDFETAAKMERLIREIADSEIERLRPAPRLAVVRSINTVDRNVSVVFTGETDVVVVPYASVVPSVVGQIVRVAGTPSDRYVDEVLGTTKAASLTKDAADAAAAAAAAAAGVETTIIQKIAVFDIKSPKPLYETVNPTSYSTLPRSAVQLEPTSASSSGGGSTGTEFGSNTGSGGSGSTGATSSNGSHTHTLPGHTHSISSHSHSLPNHTHGIQYGVPTFTVTDGSALGGFTRIGQDEKLTAMSWPGIGTPGSVFAKVLIMAPDGSVNKALDESPDVGGQYDSIEMRSIVFTFPNELVVEQGSIVLLLVRATGSIQHYGKRLWTVPVTSGFYPKFIGVSAALKSGIIPDALTTSQVVESSFVPYMEIGSNVIAAAPIKRILDDNFDRGNTPANGPANIGDMWSMASSLGYSQTGMHIRDNAVAFLYSSGNDGWNLATYAKPMATDKVIAKFHVGAVQVSPATTRIMVRSGGNTGKAIAIAINATTLNLEQFTVGYSGYNLAITSTVIAPTGRTVAYGDEISFQVGEDVAGVFHPENIIVWHNSSEVIRTAVDPASVPIGSGNRYVKIYMERTPNRNSTEILDINVIDILDVAPVVPAA